jgi:hypothetical protein
MAGRVIQTSRRLAAERQIHAAIKHFREGDFECAIILCSAAEGQMPEPNAPTHLFARLKQYSAENPSSDGQKDDFNYDANWMKHGNGADEVEIEELMITSWLYRAISKYHAVYEIGTPEMAALFPWAGEAGFTIGNVSPEEPPHAV